MSRRPLSLKLSPLAVCLAAALFSLPVDARPLRLNGSGRAADSTISSAPLGGINLPVTSCLDDGSGGTLREVLAAAGEGDTVDLTALACSTITLTQGQLAISLDDVSLVGPGDHEITIDAAYGGRAIYHTGGGTLGLDHLGIRNGVLDGTAGKGGCVYSAGSVTASHVHIGRCVNAIYGGSGGGLAAMKAAIISDSSVTDSSSMNTGGIFAYDSLTIERSTVSGNTALHAAGAYVYYGPMRVIDSTISGNTATGSSGGGMRAYYGLDMVNSTVSGNIAVSIGGGIAVAGTAEVSIRNSTIVFNQGADGGGIGGDDSTLSMTSTIVARNLGRAGVYDMGGIARVNGSHNLIMTTTATVPPDTLIGDPGIAALADNGGPTQTHALLAGSIAIDTGANPDALLTDQRGFARTSGVATDIGAYEVQLDVVFADSFEAAGARR